ncbi:MAG: hypothetical protein AB1345_14490 [Chloroflexota bacterium]
MVSRRRIFDTWWPLAASWVLMGFELPALSAILARLPDPKIHLAAYGGVVFALALIIEAPIIMLLSASTALSKDWASYLKIRTFMHVTGAIITVIHGLVAFTPLYSFVVEELIGAPAEIVEPARWGLMIMTPWSWAIAYRRFNQGVLIRFGHSRAMGIGTVTRLGADILVLTIGYLLAGRVPGIVVATSAVILGVITEAVYSGLRVQPVLRDELSKAPLVEPPLTWRTFFDFYIPLALTSLLFLLTQPIGSAAISRMPLPLDSLAVWPVVSGAVFLFRSMGIAYNEVVVALLDKPNSAINLRRFTFWLAGSVTALLLIVSLTPLSRLYFEVVAGLPPDLSAMSRTAFWIAIPWPALSALQSWYQGVILHSKRTRGITEAIAIFLTTVSSLLYLGILWNQVTGIYIGMAALLIASVIQTIWLAYRSSPTRKSVLAHDKSSSPVRCSG